MEIRLGSTRLSLHPLMLLFALLGCFLGARTEIAALMVSLSLHELAHWLAARLMHVGIEHIRLMPFGGAAHIENPYILGWTQLFFISLAGPLANLLLIFICGAMAYWQLLPPSFALIILQINLVLMLFNLLPALPLDGGRMLYAILFPIIGRERALNIGIILGRILASMMLAASIAIWILSGKLNPSLLFSGIFILAAAPDERRALCSTRLHTLLNSLKPLSRPIPANIFAIDESCSLRSALRASSPNMLTLYAVYSGEQLKTITDDRHLLTLALEHSPDTPVSGA